MYILSWYYDDDDDEIHLFKLNWTILLKNKSNHLPEMRITQENIKTSQWGIWGKHGYNICKYKIQYVYIYVYYVYK